MGSNKRAKHFYFGYQTESIDQIWVHPSYNNKTHPYDIALLRLKDVQELERNEVWPVCLPDKEVDSYAGTRAIVVGWGRLSAETQQKPKILQELQGTVLSKDNFQQQYKQCYGIEIGTMA